MAAIFDARHPLHGLAALIGIPSLPIAALLISLSLVRRQAAHRSLLWMAALTWISLVLMSATIWIALSLNGGKIGPGVPVGWLNRFLVAAYCAWLITAAWHAYSLRQRELPQH
jgi:hypothetical protein